MENNPTFETPKHYGEHLKDGMKCWRCKRDFGNKFAELKVWSCLRKRICYVLTLRSAI